MVKTKPPAPATLPSQATPAALCTAAHFEPSENDIIDDILARVIAMAPGFEAALARRISHEAREQWGGDRPYIARIDGQGLSERNLAIKRDYLKGEHLHLLQRRYQLSRARIWQIIKS